jgi:chromosome segregation ATPase
MQRCDIGWVAETASAEWRPGREVGMKSLRVALSKIEKGSQLLERLKELKKDGEVEDEPYAAKKEQYEGLIAEGKSELESIRSSLSTKLESLKRDLEKYPQELKDLELQSKLGEIDADTFTRKEQKLRARIDKLEENVEETERYLAAKTAEDAGGFIDVSLDGKTTAGRVTEKVADKVTGWLRRR